MSEKIEPALTAEEWPIVYSWHSHNVLPVVSFFPTAHATAAANLHNQPFGFTREDVQLLREFDGDYRALSFLADRIEALLPPDK